MKLYVSCLAHRSIHPATVRSLLRLERRLAEEGVPHRIDVESGDALVWRARSRVASNFLGTPYSVLLLIDDDVAFDDVETIRMCEAADERGVVGGLYLTRNTLNPAARLLPDIEVVVGGEERFFEVEALPTGFLAIHRKVLEAIRPTLQPSQEGIYPWWPFFREDTVTVEGRQVMIGEDFSFMRRVREQGFTPFVDAEVEVGHVVERVVYPEDALNPPPAIEGKAVGFFKSGGRVVAVERAK